MKIIFLGTGASGGTPGTDKSLRLESSLLIKNKLNILIDVTRNFVEQSKKIDKTDDILLTHGHQDACGGINQLRSWWQSKNLPPIPVFAHRKVITRIQKKFKQLDHCKFIEIKDHQSFNLGQSKITACQVPHTKDKNFPTFAWKIQDQKIVIYASDIAIPTTKFKNFCKDANLLIIDGATWKRKIFTHLRIDQDLPKICQWPVNKIILTQIGKSVPPHEKFTMEVAKICPKAIPAYDGIVIPL